MLTTDALYREHWKYVHKLLPAYGVFGHWVDDVAQEVWYTVHVRLPTYSPEQGTPRAWITGIVRNCAANHRYYQRREHVGLLEDLREAAAASRASGAELDNGSVRGRGPLNPEQLAVVYWMIRQALEDDEQFEAFVLRHFFGHSIEEIAGIQEATESAVEWRIHMAKERLKRDDETPSSAFVGFGTLEALVEAMQSPDPPSSRGRELWERISARIGQVPGPAPGLPASAPTGPLLSKPVLAGLLGGVLLLGGELGAIACGPEPTAQVASEPDRTAHIAPQATASADPGILAAAPVSAPSVDASATAAGSSTPAAPRPEPRSQKGSPAAQPTDNAERESMLLIVQMRAAADHGNCAAVRGLYAEHVHDFPHLDVALREFERARCP